MLAVSKSYSNLSYRKISLHLTHNSKLMLSYATRGLKNVFINANGYLFVSKLPYLHGTLCN